MGSAGPALPPAAIRKPGKSRSFTLSFLEIYRDSRHNLLSRGALGAPTLRLAPDKKRCRTRNNKHNNWLTAMT
jgi:hypothetical protein